MGVGDGGKGGLLYSPAQQYLVEHVVPPVIVASQHEQLVKFGIRGNDVFIGRLWDTKNGEEERGRRAAEREREREIGGSISRELLLVEFDANFEGTMSCGKLQPWEMPVRRPGGRAGTRLHRMYIQP